MNAVKNICLIDNQLRTKPLQNSRTGTRSSGFPALINQRQAAPTDRRSPHSGSGLSDPCRSADVRPKTSDFLEQLRQHLRSKGKPLDQLFLQRENQSALVNFMGESGYTENDIQKCLDRIFPDIALKKVPLSDVVAALEQIGLPDEQVRGKVFLEASLVPHIETVLQDFGLAPRAVEQFMARVRTADGHIDLRQMISELQSVSAGGHTNGANAAHQSIEAAADIEALGIKLPASKKMTPVSLRDFMTGLQTIEGKVADVVGGKR